MRLLLRSIAHTRPQNPLSHTVNESIGQGTLSRHTAHTTQAGRTSIAAMGNKNSHFSDEELDVLEECTFFTRREILKIHKWFKQIAGKTKDTLTRTEFLALPELAQNPFKERIADAFITNEDSNVTFDDFLDFLSVFSESATRDVKAFYAFRLYDFDEDGYLNEDDIKKVLKLVVGEEFTEEEIKTVCDNIFEEVDIDGDKRLSFVEFEHVGALFARDARVRVHSGTK
ncbi:EF-hand [Gonapodya prolifera JEL478]|uniref:EF-hand n=1 Tax=Gonapodya prolifera (strain JEL478) TaxID=1344416 RepID=A0A139AGM9_GONPJ|nr:EF-hand [Gonapodya prolifera JEL478]|eukprot:KXS15971.1 EF-hand [Gonapodya prolifera JEL478]